MVELEQQLLRSRPTAEERYVRRDEVTLTAGDGASITLRMPETTASD